MSRSRGATPEIEHRQEEEKEEAERRERIHARRLELAKLRKFKLDDELPAEEKNIQKEQNIECD